VANWYDLKLRELLIEGLAVGAGEIQARNLTLLALAAISGTAELKSITIAVHAGTPYWDCSPTFLNQAQALIGGGRPNPVEIHAPFVHLDKPAVAVYALDNTIPIGLTYSCEAACIPCGTCLSCGDKEAVHEFLGGATP
jgi:7-cyano-7-deazaguanine synthase